MILKFYKMNWQLHDTVMYNVLQNNYNKIAAFDLDDTLIVTKSGKRFSEDPNDWKLKYLNTQDVIRNLSKNGYTIVIFTNQKNLIKRKKHLDFQTKIHNIIKYIHVPMNVFVSTEDDIFRKPMTGMWKMFLTLCKINDVNYQDSFYCGDAAGRVYNKKEKDHNISDLYFARNIKIRFKYPEEVFMQPVKKYQINDIYATSQIHSLDIKQFSWNLIEKDINKKPHAIIMIGCPASGKSTLAYELQKKYSSNNYYHYNNDINCSIKQLKEEISNNTNLIIDNTNGNITTRTKIYDMLKQKYHKIIIYFDYPKELCYHLNNMRMQITKNKKIPMVVYHTYFKKLTVPTSEEGTIITLTPSHGLQKLPPEYYYYYDII